jgi:DNA-binding NtrC family response regulator
MNTKKALIIVDDQAVYLRSLEFVLTKRFTVYTAESHEQAIELLTNKQMNVALLDVRLSETDKSNIDGLRILEWIQMNQPQVTVFMMSAYTEFEYAEKSMNLGAKYFFRKPIDIVSLIAVIEQKG